MTLKKILCVIPNKELCSALQSSIRQEFKEKYSQIDWDFAEDYHEAVLKIKNEYDVYILNDLIPKKKTAKDHFFKGKKPFSLKLIEDIYEKEESYKKIILASSYNEILETAKKMGLKNLYNKLIAKPPYRDIEDLPKDLKDFLGV